MTSKFLLQSKDRLNVWKSVVWGKWRRFVLLLITLISILGIIQSQIPTGSSLLKYAYLPQLDWLLWVIIGLAFLWVITLEGAYSLLREYLPLNWIERYRIQYGRYPQLPEYLHPLVNKYTKGEPVSKDIEPIAPSGQLWNRMVTSQKKEWKEMVEWLGEDPQDLVDLMKMMLPKDW